jgi:hypothetical protein
MIKQKLKTIINNILITILLINSITITAQNINISGRVVDNVTEEALSYSNIMVINQIHGVSANNNGEFSLLIPEDFINDTLIISHIGYKSKKISINKISGNRFPLEKRITILKEISIKTKDHLETNNEIHINKFRKNKCFIRYAPMDTLNYHWIPNRPQEPTIEAAYFKYSPEKYDQSIIKEIWVYVISFKTPAVFNLRILGAKEDHSPGNDLIDTTLLVHANKSKELIKINIVDLAIIFPKNGLFVGLELLVLPENIYKEEINGNLVTFFSPYLSFIPTKEKGCFWIYSKGKWQEFNQQRPSFTSSTKNKIRYHKPAFSLILAN